MYTFSSCNSCFIASKSMTWHRRCINFRLSGGRLLVFLVKCCVFGRFFNEIWAEKIHFKLHDRIDFVCATRFISNGRHRSRCKLIGIFCFCEKRKFRREDPHRYLKCKAIVFVSGWRRWCWPCKLCILHLTVDCIAFWIWPKPKCNSPFCRFRLFFVSFLVANKSAGKHTHDHQQMPKCRKCIFRHSTKLRRS